MNDILQIEISLVDHCNLNCQMCDHFSPIATPNSVNLESYSKDLQTIANVINTKALRLHLVGGEPLLHPQLNDLLCISRRILKDSEIVLITNGILLPRKDHLFWSICSDKNIHMKVTKYPIKINYEPIEEMAKSQNVNFSYMNTKPIKTSYYNPFDLAGNQNKLHSYKACEYTNRCNTIRDGKFYPCPVVANAQLFNRAFNKELLITKDDYLELCKIKSLSDIQTFVSTPINFCKYCKVQSRLKQIPWEQSQRSIHEWS